MLELYKTVLRAVSFDRLLFEKELYKSISSLPAYQVPELKKWCYKHFSDKLLDVLHKVFGKREMENLSF